MADTLLTLANAVDISRSALRDSSGDSFKTEAIREAVRTLVADLLTRSPINTTQATVTATIDDPFVDMSVLAGFRSERFINAQIDYKEPLEFVDYRAVSRDLDETSSSGVPEMIAFQTSTRAYISPRPSTAASIKVVYSLPGPVLLNDTDTINVPAEYLRPAFWWGVPALLRSAGQEGDEGDAGWVKYLDVVRRLRGFGVGNRGHIKIDRSKYI